MINSSKRTQNILLALLSGFALFAAWPTRGFAPLLLVAFVPLLWLESQLTQNRKWDAFLYSYLTFVTWNTATTWWIYYSTAFGAIGAILCNSLFMATVFYLFHSSRIRMGEGKGYWILPLFFTAFEYLHLNWDLSWPWLTLGNGFSSWYKYVQWYEYTGVLGGSLWIWTSNILVFNFIKRIYNKQSYTRELGFALITLLIPAVISLLIYVSYSEKNNPVKVVVSQPNVDPYNEKFSGIPASEQVARFLQPAAPLMDSTVDYLVGPETTVPDGIWEETIRENESVQILKSYAQHYPKTKIVLGISSYKEYKKEEERTETARAFKEGTGFYDAFNSAIQIDTRDSVPIYHKSKLVIGVEMIPYPFIFKNFEKLAINLGGTTGSLGTQKERSVFVSEDTKFKVAPVICYESIYGDFVTGYIRKGANLLFIITNDGWWEDTQGYRQHLSFASLRAIETRRSIARSANTGISCFVNQKGDIINPTAWWVATAIQGTINANDTETFYVRHGDYIGIFTAFLSVLIIAYFAISKRLRKNRI